LHISEADSSITRELVYLSKGPKEVGLRYQGFMVNGFRFHIKEVERKRKTQNSGVSVNAITSSFSNRRDENPILSDVAYFGALKNVIELDYGGDRRVVLFECDWVSNGKRLKKDADGFLLANFSNVPPHKEPFILASQAAQVFYIEESSESDWHVIVVTDARSVYKMGDIVDVETHLQAEVCDPAANLGDDNVCWVREGDDED
jgi:hypothetical protein